MQIQTGEDANANEINRSHPEKEDEVLDATAHHCPAQHHLLEFLSSHTLKWTWQWSNIKNDLL